MKNAEPDPEADAIPVEAQPEDASNVEDGDDVMPDEADNSADL